MSVCVPCRKAGVDREASAFDGEVPVCDDHANGNFMTAKPTPAIDPARKEQTMSEPVPSVVPERKRRGRKPKVKFIPPPKKKRGPRLPKLTGLDDGPPLKRRRGRPRKDPDTIDETERNFSLAHLPSNILTQGGDLDMIIARLHQKREKIDRAISALRELYGPNE